MFLLRRSEKKSATRVRQVFASSASRRKSSDPRNSDEDSAMTPVYDSCLRSVGEGVADENKKHVKWADELSDSKTESEEVQKPCGAKEGYYREKIRRRVLNGNSPGCSQCPQNIYKILHDADMFCDVESNKVRAARCLVPIDWLERPDCIPILPFDKLLELCAPQFPCDPPYPLWAHFCFNFWVRYDHDIKVEPLIYWRPLNSMSTFISTSSSDMSSCSSLAHPRIHNKAESHIADSPRSALVLKDPGEIVPFNGSSSWYGRSPLTRSYSWLQRTVAQSHALIRALMRKPVPNIDESRDIIDELSSEVLQNEDLRFEVRFLTLEDLIKKLEKMKVANHGHQMLCNAINELVAYYKDYGLHTISLSPSDTDDATTSLSHHLNDRVSQQASATVV